MLWHLVGLIQEEPSEGAWQAGWEGLYLCPSGPGHFSTMGTDRRFHCPVLLRVPRPPLHVMKWPWRMPPAMVFQRLEPSTCAASCAGPVLCMVTATLGSFAQCMSIRLSWPLGYSGLEPSACLMRVSSLVVGCGLDEG